jgi:hypothetical protein
LLTKFAEALKVGALLFDSMAGSFEREIIGDHLEEAIRIGKSEEYKQYYSTHFHHVIPKENSKCLFKRIK